MFFYVRHLFAKQKVEREWQRLESYPIRFSAHHSSIRIRVLVDFFSSDNHFRTESGVSYLVSINDRHILFDLGYNQKRENPSPLRANLAALDLDPTNLDGVFISHNHLDHVGGMLHQVAKWPALDSLFPLNLSDAAIWAPLQLRHPKYFCQAVPHAMELNPGFASTGPLPAHLYYLGMIREQALLISLKGRGTILISGCGHPGILEMVRFAKKITGEEVYAVVGGLHLIATKGRDVSQKYIAANQPVWRLPTKSGIQQMIRELKLLGVKKLAPSAHDSCDEALQMMRDVFKDGYIDLRVGEEIQFASPE